MDGKVVCFFQSEQKFQTRYATFGFMHEANLDEGTMWPTAFALKELTVETSPMVPPAFAGMLRYTVTNKFQPREPSRLRSTLVAHCSDQVRPFT